MDKLTNNDILLLSNAFGHLKGSKYALPIKVRWCINKNSKVIAEHSKDFDEARIELAKECAFKYKTSGNTKEDAIKKAQKIKDKEKKEEALEKAQKLKGVDYKEGDPQKDEKDNFIIEDKKRFTDELNDLLKEEVEVNLHKITIEDCKNFDTIGEEHPFLDAFIDFCIKE